MKKLFVIMLAVAWIAAASPAAAGGFGHGYHGYGHYGYRSPGHGDLAGAILGGVLVGALVGSLVSHPAPRYYAPAQPRLGNCRPITGTGYLDGRPALYGGTSCQDAWGNAYVMRGSEYFIRYLR